MTDFQQQAVAALAKVQDLPREYIGMHGRDRKFWRRLMWEAGVRLHLCRYCGFPGKLNGQCPVCAGPPKEQK